MKKNIDSPFKLLIFIILSVLFFGAVTYKIILVPNGPVHEFDGHILFAVQMAQEERIVIPHFLFQLLTIVHHKLLGVFHLPTYQITGINQTINYDWGFSAFIVMLEIYVGILLVLVYYLKLRFQNLKNFENVAYFVGFGISICAPIFLLAPIDGKFYLGYITPSTIYTIPTQILLKFPSLVLFLLTPMLFTKNNDNLKLLLGIIFLVVLSGLAKPSWLLIMMPALGVVALIYVLKGYYVNWITLSVALISSAVVLGWQYYFKFMDAAAPIYNSKIIITSPFEVWSYFSNFLFIKTILSILFPLYIAIFFYKVVKDDFLFSYGWLLFLIGLIYMGFLGESGIYKLAGNFVWCAQIACFMLFVSAAAVFFSKCFIKYNENKPKIIIGSILFCLHVSCGLIYYIRSFENIYH